MFSHFQRPAQTSRRVSEACARTEGRSVRGPRGQWGPWGADPPLWLSLGTRPPFLVQRAGGTRRWLSRHLLGTDLSCSGGLVSRPERPHWGSGGGAVLGLLPGTQCSPPSPARLQPLLAGPLLVPPSRAGGAAAREPVETGFPEPPGRTAVASRGLCHGRAAGYSPRSSARHPGRGRGGCCSVGEHILVHRRSHCKLAPKAPKDQHSVLMDTGRKASLPPLTCLWVLRPRRTAPFSAAPPPATGS